MGPVVAVAALPRDGASPGAVLHHITVADQYVVARAASQPVAAPFAVAVDIGRIADQQVGIVAAIEPVVGAPAAQPFLVADHPIRSEARRVGHEWCRTCRSRLSPYH